MTNRETEKQPEQIQETSKETTEAPKMNPEEVEEIDKAQKETLDEIRNDEPKKDAEFAKEEAKDDIDSVLGEGKTEQILKEKQMEEPEKTEIKKEKAEEEMKLDEEGLRTELGNLYEDAVNGRGEFKPLLQLKSVEVEINGEKQNISLAEAMAKKFGMEKETIIERLEGIYNETQKQEQGRLEFIRKATNESIIRGGVKTSKEKPVEP